MTGGFREFLARRGIKACIPPRSGRRADIPVDRTTFRLRPKIENMFARIRDWRRVATRYNRCTHAFLSTIAIAATVSYWL